MSGEEIFDFRERAAYAAPESWSLSQPVFFVGFMGAGKTSVTRKLARLAGASAIDMDRYIERSCGMKIRDIFAEAGEAGFRTLETDVLRELMEGEPRLVSCGGGVVLSEKNRALLKEGAYVVYLQVTAQEAASRISDVATRPLFGDVDNAQRVLESRLPLYEEVADMSIETAGRGTGAIAREAFRRLKEEGVLWQPR